MKGRNEVKDSKRRFQANCNIYKDEEQVKLTLEMPGVSKDSLDVRVDNDTLIIEGRKKSAASEGSYLIREIRDGDYYQEFTIDDTIDRNNIDASISNGVVTLILKLKDSVKPRKIEVKAV